VVPGAVHHMTSDRRWFIARRCSAQVAAALLLIGSAACDRTGAERTRGYLENGDRLARAGKFAAASIEYRNAIRLTPSSVEAHEKLAGVAERGGQTAVATDTLLRVAELKPDDRTAQLRAASVYLLSGRYEESRARAEAAIHADAADATAHLVLGEALAGLHDQARSEASLRDTIRLAPALPAAHVALASRFWSAGNVAEAEGELRKAVEVGPRDNSANRALAIFLMATGRGRQAEPAWAVVAASPGGLPFALTDYLVAMNRLGDAERALMALAAGDVNRDAALVRLAAVQSARNRPVDAHRTLQTVLQDSPHSMPALLLEARVFQSEHRWDDALRVTHRAVAANPDQLEPLLVEGDIFAARGDAAEADRSFARAAALSPGDPRPYLAQAKSRLARGRAMESVSFVERARTIAPGDLDTRLTLVDALAQAGQRTLAIEASKAAISDWPRQAALYLQLGRLQFADGRLADAQTTLATALRLDPTSIPALRALVEVEMHEGQSRSALTRIDRQLQQQPDSLELLLLAGRTYAADRQNEKATATFRRIVELNPAGSGATMLGLLLEEQNQPAEAERAFERALAAHPSDGVAANNLAWLYQQEGRLDEALRWATVAREQLQSSEANDTLGWIRIRRGEFRAAVPVLLGAVRAKPENPLYHYHLAVAYSKTGSAVQARDELHRALASHLTFSGREDAAQLQAELDGVAVGSPH
jgi:tetratricopeptide (TPR) repeat protein